MNPAKATACLVLLLVCTTTRAQMVTGVWHGKLNGQKAEIKIIKSGDSLTGTSYYYASAGNYRRYTIKGYFDERSNQAVWWDDKLVEEKTGSLLGSPGKAPLLSRADFNCPGGGVMKLDGSSNEKNEQVREGKVHLQKTDRDPVFPDEWDWVIENFTAGTNDPAIIDSVSLVAFHPNKQPAPREEPPAALAKKPGMVMVPPAKEKDVQPEPETAKAVPPAKTVEEKFTVRKKKIFTTIPVSGDSISLSFYDNAIVDGDSISLFLDGRLLFSHIRLSDKPYTVKVAVTDLKEESDLVMVAENLGDIPPNTSYMVAMAGEKRYTANLASTEDSSAVIRLKKSTR